MFDILNDVVKIIFLLSFTITCICIFFAIICYFIQDYLHYKKYGYVIDTANFSNFSKEYYSILLKQKAQDATGYRISYLLFYRSLKVLPYSAFIMIITVLFFVFSSN